MTKYSVITTIERIPFVIDKDMTLMQKFSIKKNNLMQYETWRLVCKYFMQGNGVWDEQRQRVDHENEFNFYHNCSSYEEAQEEHSKIITNAFKNKMNFMAKALRMTGKKHIKTQDDNPEFQKLQGNLSALGIFLEVTIKQKHF